MKISATAELQPPMTLSARIAAGALGMTGLGLLSGRGSFAAVLVIGILATMASPHRAETWKLFRRATATPPVMLAAGVLVAWLPATVLSYSPWESVQVMGRMIIFVALGIWVYAYFARWTAALDLLVKALFVGLAFGVAPAILGIVTFPDVMVLIKGRPATSPADAVLMVKGFTSAAIVLMPFVLWGGWRLSGPWRSRSLVLVAALFALAVVAGSRAGMAGAIGALGIALVACLTRRDSRAWAGGLLVVLALAVAGIFLYLTGHGYAGSVPEDVLYVPVWLVDSHRQVIWEYVLDLAAQRPWFGWGINTINLIPILPGNSPVAYGVPVLPSHPHNWLLEVFAETGIVGGLPMLFAVIVQFVIMLRRYRANGKPEILAALSASAAFWISGLFNFSFWSAWWQVSYILFLALLYAATPPEESCHVSGVDLGLRVGGKSIGG